MNQNKQSAEKEFPFYASGVVVKGFGRGSKDLGIPTGQYNYLNNLD